MMTVHHFTFCVQSSKEAQEKLQEIVDEVTQIPQDGFPVSPQVVALSHTVRAFGTRRDYDVFVLTR